MQFSVKKADDGNVPDFEVALISSSKVGGRLRGPSKHSEPWCCHPSPQHLYKHSSFSAAHLQGGCRSLKLRDLSPQWNGDWCVGCCSCLRRSACAAPAVQLAPASAVQPVAAWAACTIITTARQVCLPGGCRATFTVQLKNFAWDQHDWVSDPQAFWACSSSVGAWDVDQVRAACQPGEWRRSRRACCNRPAHAHGLHLRQNVPSCCRRVRHVQVMFKDATGSSQWLCVDELKVLG
jgi:hypothetical protein